MKTTEETKAPDGYRVNALGHLVPEDQIREVDKLRDDLVRRMIGRAKECSEAVSRFRLFCRMEVSAFLELAAEEHGVKMGGEKGNLTLSSFDGSFRIVRAVDERIEFTEGLAVAREIIERCIARWSAGADGNLVALVRQAFEADKAGNLSTARVLALLSVRLEDAEWQQGMAALRDSIRVAGSKAYVRFYERDASGKYNQIPLDAEK